MGAKVQNLANKERDSNRKNPRDEITPIKGQGYWLTLVRINELALIGPGSQSFNEITYQVGYEDIPFFRKVFVKLTGLRPKEYQQRFAGYSAKPVLQV